MSKEYVWHLSDLKNVKKNNLKVFTCFSCGGGSSMGYKLAGYDVIGNLEIDKKINNMYVINNKPKYNFNMDIRDFAKLEIYPDELYELDILDGSPPCTSFSIAGNRDKDWGKKKSFKEGGKKQTLDDLFFEFIKVAEKLKPKVIVAENVKGIIIGKAKGYCNLILKQLDKVGYETQIFLLNSATMGVPQKRERVFFISYRKDLRFNKLNFRFNEKPIKFGEYRSIKGKKINPDTKTYELLKYMKKRDISLADINKRINNSNSLFTHCIVHDYMVCNTITSGGGYIRGYDKQFFSDYDYITTQTFPQDYNFSDNEVKYVCGMSVPPLMMKRISEQVCKQWLKEK